MPQMRITTLSLLCLSFWLPLEAGAQKKAVLVYSMGEAGYHTPYCELSSDGVRVGTVKLGEYITLELNTSRSPILEINRGGVGTAQVSLRRDSEPQFVKVTLNRKGVDAIVDHSPPQAIVDLLPDSNDSASGLPDDVASRILYSGEAWPAPGSTIQLKFESSSDSAPSDFFEGMVMSSLAKRYTIVNRDNLDDILDEQKMSLSGITSDSGAIQAGELLSSAWTVLIRYSGELLITSRFTAINNETAQQTVPLMTQDVEPRHVCLAIEESLLEAED